METAALPIEPPPYRTGSHGSAPANERVDPENGHGEAWRIQPPPSVYGTHRDDGDDPRSGGTFRPVAHVIDVPVHRLFL